MSKIKLVLGLLVATFLLIIIRITESLGERNFSKVYLFLYIVVAVAAGISGLLYHDDISYIHKPSYIYPFLVTVSTITLVLLEWGRRSLKITLKYWKLND